LIELADTSAWTMRHRSADLLAEFNEKLQRGGIATCDMVVLELLWSRRDLADLRDTRDRLSELCSVSIGPRVWRRAADLLEILAEDGLLHHRRAPVQDLLIAAAAESAELPVLHYDRHFELIAEVTGQPMRAIAPLGSLD
jgi:predicted nucleic acid-binding protein